METRITQLFGISKPIISGGMVWCSGWRLASAVSNAGGLGLLGAGSMHPETLAYHIDRMHEHTNGTWGVNLPLMYPEIEKVIDLIIERGVKVVFTSAGSPKKYTARFHNAGIKVAHVVSSSRFAAKCEEAGVDAVVAEGFEAGGHNGREELTTMALIPQVRRATSLPLNAAGGIGSGEALLAAMALGAEGVQLGTLFALSAESSAHDAFKEYCISLPEDATMLALKAISPTRLARNPLFQRIAEAEARGEGADALREILGQKAAKRAIFEGDVENGEVEIGQVVAQVKRIDTVADIFQRLEREYTEAMERLQLLN